MTIKTGNKSLSASMFVVPNPRNLIEEKIRNQQWFEGFALSVSNFEYYGAKKINRYCYCYDVSKNVFDELFENPLEDLGATKIAQLLRFMNVVDQITYSNMMKVISVRHRLVHPWKGGIESWFPTSTEGYEKLLKDAIDCIEKIQSVRYVKKK